VEFITASSYLNSHSTGQVIIQDKSLPNLKGKDVLIVEDIVDSGLTIKSLMDFIKSKEPSSIKVCSFLMKPLRVKESISKIDYIGFTLTDGFVVGYGLDYNQNYRELPHVIELLDVEA
jgi:hypoxanthine phosphoribosyltransferase